MVLKMMLSCLNEFVDFGMRWALFCMKDVQLAEGFDEKFCPWAVDIVFVFPLW